MDVRQAVIAIVGFAAAAVATVAAQSAWTPQASGVTARFRGVSAVNDRVAWASGTDGTIVRTVDGGATWQRISAPADVDAAKLDFRDIDAVDERVAYALSIGPGEASRIYKTSDGGATWVKQFVNTDPKAFFDAMTFWTPERGLVISDSVESKFVILTTRDGGNSWTRVPAAALPAALPNEGAFAASGTNIAVYGTDYVWIGTGAADKARVLRSTDGGRTWSVADTPLQAGPSAGIFSIAFRDTKHGVVVGGDYKKEGAAIDNVAITNDGGVTWTLVKDHGLSGFRSVVTYVPGPRAGVGSTLLAIGPTGADVSTDDGRTWKPTECPGYHTFSFARRAAKGDGARFDGWKAIGWGAGEKGRIGLLRWPELAPASSR